MANNGINEQDMAQLKTGLNNYIQEGYFASKEVLISSWSIADKSQVIKSDIALTEEFVNLPISYLDKYFTYALIHQKKAIDSIKFSWNSKCSLGVLLSTATTALYFPTLAMIITSAIAICAIIENMYTKKYDKTFIVLGICSTITGVGRGVPLIHKFVMAGFVGLTVILGGSSALFNPALATVAKVMIGMPGYMLTNAIAYGIYSLLNTERFKEAITETIQESANAAKYEAAHQIQEKISYFKCLGMPFGKMAQSVIAPIVNNTMNKIANKAINKINNIGSYGQSTILSHFQQMGENYLANLIFLPKEVLSIAKEQFTDIIIDKSSVDTSVGKFLII